MANLFPVRLWSLAVVGLASGTVFVSGAAALVYEVILGRLLSVEFGASTDTHGIVLAVFMGGLALGYLLGGRFEASRLLLLQRYAVLELWIGLCVFLCPQVIGLAADVYGVIAPHPGSAFAILDGIHG